MQPQACRALAAQPAAAASGRPRALQRPAAAPSRAEARPRPAVQAKATKHNGGSHAVAPELRASPDHSRAIKMANLATTYFKELLSSGASDVEGTAHQILAPHVQHKDMVRNEGRYGISDYLRFVQDVQKAYPRIWVRPTQFGVVDDTTLFVAFEGQATSHTPNFKGVDLFHFDEGADRITEVEVFRSNWLGAQGHNERKVQREERERAKK